MRHNRHTHRCRACGATIQCHAPLVRNDDGFPDPVCVLVMEEDPMICDNCTEAQDVARLLDEDEEERVQ